jgi:hypothetical protein
MLLTVGGLRSLPKIDSLLSTAPQSSSRSSEPVTLLSPGAIVYWLSPIDSVPLGGDQEREARRLSACFGLVKWRNAGHHTLQREPTSCLWLSVPASSLSLESGSFYSRSWPGH